MGTGEPMDNYDNIVKFVRLLSDENGLNISQRNITVSTCGIVPRIKQLADEYLTITLAISLHAPNQQKRAELMPIANKYEIHELIDACEYYFNKTGRRITFEYSLVGGVNDRDQDATELGELIGHLNCHVKDATHLHEQPEAVGSHDHEHCAICQNAFNHVFAANQPNFRATAKKITLPHLWAPVCEFVARVALPIHPQAP